MLDVAIHVLWMLLKDYFRRLYPAVGNKFPAQSTDEPDLLLVTKNFW